MEIIEIDGLKFADSNLGTDEDNPYGKYYTWEEAMEACPKGWRLPTLEEWGQLHYNTAYEWVKNNETVNGMNSMKFTDRASGKSLFLPANSPLSGHNYGLYWSSTCYPKEGLSYSFGFNHTGFISPSANDKRNNSLAVRCIQD